MKVRTKLTLTFLALALGPLATIGVLTFQRSEQALRDSLGASFQRTASEAIDKVDRGLYSIQERVRVWVGLELMQEVVTGDLDGRISSFLLAIGRDAPEFARIEVKDAEGRVVAASAPDLVGASLPDDPAFGVAITGRTVVRDAEPDPWTGAWVVTFCAPIHAHFDENVVVGVLCARWAVRELHFMTEGLPQAERSESLAGGVITRVIRRDGLEISALNPGHAAALSGNLIERGVVSARLASEGNDGYAVEDVPGQGRRLIGYGASKGYRSFEGLGWSALVAQDLGQAFAPIERLKLLFGGAGALSAIFVALLSLAISRRLADPLVRMADVAQRVARGNLEGRVGFRSGDEVGTLAEAFDRMIEELKDQRSQLVADMERRERAERDATAAKDAAEESSTRLSAVLDTMGEGLVTLDGAGRITMVNHEVCALWGYSQEELLGQDVRLLLREGADAALARAGLIELASPGGSERRRLTAEGRRSDGSIFPLEIIATTTRLGSRLFATAATVDLTERHRAEEQVRASLAEKEALLKEVHHRVKNNLQVVMSLLRLQADHIKDPLAFHVFKDSESRVRSMALTHEMLYRSPDLSRIDVAQYLGTLARDLLATYRGESSGVTMRVAVDPVTLVMDDAIHCGLLVTELVSNAIKHAYPGDQAGEVRVSFRQESDGSYRLTVADDGVGLPDDLSVDSVEDTLGLQLVETLASQLDGSVRVERGSGTTFEVLFRATGEAS